MERMSPAKKLVTTVTGKPVEDVLRELYVDKRHSQQEIADHLSISRDTVVSWLREYGISREDRDQLEPLVSA